MSYGKTQSKGTQGDFGRVATIRHLTRIIVYLSENEWVHKTNIQKNIGLDLSFVNGALLFLVNHGIVLKQKDFRRKASRYWGNVWYYKLSKDERIK